jgi:transcriptional regulator with XRE-family HTH domain
MLTADDIIQRLRAAKNLAEISRKAGIPYGSLRKIVTGETSDPRVSTLEAARHYFEQEDLQPGGCDRRASELVAEFAEILTEGERERLSHAVATRDYQAAIHLIEALSVDVDSRARLLHVANSLLVKAAA